MSKIIGLSTRGEIVIEASENNGKKVLGHRIREYRRTKGSTAREVAIALGISYAQLNVIERGDSYPNPAMLPDIADYFNIDIEILLIGTDAEFQEKVRNLDSVKNIFSQRLRKTRKKRDLSQKQLAAILEVSDYLIGKWENGIMPSDEIVTKISEVLNVEKEWLLGQHKQDSENRPEEEQVSLNQEEANQEMSIETAVVDHQVDESVVAKDNTDEGIPVQNLVSEIQDEEVASTIQAESTVMHGVVDVKEITEKEAKGELMTEQTAEPSSETVTETISESTSESTSEELVADEENKQKRKRQKSIRKTATKRKPSNKKTRTTREKQARKQIVAEVTKSDSLEEEGKVTQTEMIETLYDDMTKKDGNLIVRTSAFKYEKEYENIVGLLQQSSLERDWNIVEAAIGLLKMLDEHREEQKHEATSPELVVKAG